LPDGWVREYDPRTKHPFWVDTKAKPPRSIWVHPFEDEEFLREHPDIRDRLTKGMNDTPSERPPPYSPRRHSTGSVPVGSTLGVPSSANRNPTSHPGTPRDDSRPKHHRGFMEKLKDKTIGTKEEREAAKRQEATARERRRQQYEAERQERMRDTSYYGQPAYGPPQGDPFTYRSRLGGMGGGGLGGYGRSGLGFGGGSGYGNRGGFGGGGMAMPLLGGLAGGLLLADVIDDFGGGGFGGGGFGGGGFDGGFGGGGFGGGGGFF